MAESLRKGGKGHPQSVGKELGLLTMRQGKETSTGAKHQEYKALNKEQKAKYIPGQKRSETRS